MGVNNWICLLIVDVMYQCQKQASFNLAHNMHIIIKSGVDNGALSPAPKTLTASSSCDNKNTSLPNKDVLQTESNSGEILSPDAITSSSIEQQRRNFLIAEDIFSIDVLKSRAADNGLCVHKATNGTDKEGNKFVKKVFFYPSRVPYKSRSQINFVRFVRRKSGIYTLSTAKGIQHVLDIWAELLPPSNVKTWLAKRARNTGKETGTKVRKRRKKRPKKTVSKSGTIQSESIADKTDAIVTGTDDINASKSAPTNNSNVSIEMRGRKITSAYTQSLTAGIKKSIQPQTEKNTDGHTSPNTSALRTQNT